MVELIPLAIVFDVVMSDVSIEGDRKGIRQHLWQRSNILVLGLAIDDVNRFKHGIVECLVLAELLGLLDKPLNVGCLLVGKNLHKGSKTLLHRLGVDVRLGIQHDFQCPLGGHGVVLLQILGDHAEQNLGVPISEIVLLEEGEDFSEVLIIARQFAEDGEFDHAVECSAESGDVKRLSTSI